MVIPLYWLLVLSLQPDGVSKQQANLYPAPFSFENYLAIFFQDNWTDGYINALIYVFYNIVITLVGVGSRSSNFRQRPLSRINQKP